MGRIVIAALAAACVLCAAGHAQAFSRQEVACQMAIAKAGKAFVAAELTSRGRCKMAVARGRSCDPAPKTAGHESKLRKVVSRCNGVSLSSLGAHSCAVESANAYALADCLIAAHESAVATLITAQFGLAGAEARVVLTGRLTQATATLLAPANFVRRRVSSAVVSLSELAIFCVTFSDDPRGATAPVADDGRFALTLTAVGEPFGCFVTDVTTGEQLATIVLRSGTADASQVEVAEGGTLGLGTVRLDLSRGEAVVDATTLTQATMCAAGAANPFDFTGTWELGCTPGPAGSGYACPTDGEGASSEIYLHRVPGVDADGHPIHWLGFWESLDAFRQCGGVEGLATTDTGTTTAAGERLGVADGPFHFASEGEIFAAIDDDTSPQPPGTTGRATAICRSSAATCSAILNNDGEGCDASSCWGRTVEANGQSMFTPYADAECQRLCAGMNLYTYGGQDPASGARRGLADAGLCGERKVVDHGVSPSDGQAFVGTGEPLGRHLLDRLRYGCDDAASVVHTSSPLTITLAAPAGASPRVCHVIERTEITLKMETPERLIGSFKRIGLLQPEDPDACAASSDPNNPVGRLLAPERFLFTLTR